MMKRAPANATMPTRATKAGLTLPELLVAASIMVLVLGIALPFLVTVHKAWQDNEGRATAFDGARAAGVFIGRGIRTGRRFSNVPSPSDQQGSLQLETIAANGTPLQRNYYFDTTGAPSGLGWVRLLETNLATGEATNARIAGPVQSLSFDVRKADGVTPAAHAWEAHFVRLSAVGATGETETTFPIASSTLKRSDPPPCALFCAANLSLQGTTAVTGDVYAGGDLFIGSQASVAGGLAYAANSVVGSGATVGVSPTPAPSMPTLDQSYYNGLLAAAQSQPDANIDSNSGSVPLNGATVYVHGYVKLRGTAELIGPGTLVATHSFGLSDLARVTGGAHVIVGRDGKFDDASQMVGGGLFYGVDSVALANQASVDAAIVTPANVSIAPLASASGIVYAAGGALISGTVTGSVYCGRDDGINDATFRADPAVMHHTVPGLAVLY